MARLLVGKKKFVGQAYMSYKKQIDGKDLQAARLRLEEKGDKRLHGYIAQKLAAMDLRACTDKLKKKEEKHSKKEKKDKKKKFMLVETDESEAERASHPIAKLGVAIRNGHKVASMVDRG